ncbi:hypothetical protein [Pseudonocardia spinosispora]|uniref:hypothetical protein n=1 Tax=Pseudonocardia spinosispora TaxID=103441 RepID=UPI00041189B4|nr:hypothetical protein [Pseudonocardia spinosispora]
MQVWLIVLTGLGALLLIAATVMIVRRRRGGPATHQQALRELRRARRESHVGSRYEPHATVCPVNEYIRQSYGL